MLTGNAGARFGIWGCTYCVKGGLEVGTSVSRLRAGIGVGNGATKARHASLEHCHVLIVSVFPQGWVCTRHENSVISESGEKGGRVYESVER